MIEFKSGLSPQDFFLLNPKLICIIGDLSQFLLQQYGYKTVITSTLRPSNGSDSGVHATGRGCDVRCAGLTVEQIQAAIDYISLEHPRKDGKDTIICHDTGSGFHFHIQVPYSKWWDPYERAIIMEMKRRQI